MIEKVLPKENSAWIYIAFLLLSLFFEISATTMPFIIGALILLAVTFRKNWVFLAAFLVGLIFDILALRTIGTTSLFFIILIFLIFIYENKFETETVPFVFVSTFLFSFSFLIFLGFSNVILQSLVSAIVTALIFRLSSRYL